MAGGMEVDPAQLLSDSGTFEDVSTKAKQIGQVLNGIYDIHGLPPEGEDEVSDQVRSTFFPAVDGLHSMFSGFGDGMTQTGDDLGNTAVLYAKSNEVNEDLV